MDLVNPETESTTHSPFKEDATPPPTSNQEDTQINGDTQTPTDTLHVDTHVSTTSTEELPSNTVYTQTQPSNPEASSEELPSSTVYTQTQPSNPEASSEELPSSTVYTQTQPSNPEASSEELPSNTVYTQMQPSNPEASSEELPSSTVYTQTQPSNPEASSEELPSSTLYTQTQPSNPEASSEELPSNTVYTQTQPSNPEASRDSFVAAVIAGEGLEEECDNDGEVHFELSSEDSEALLSLTEELDKILDPKNTLRTPPPSIDLSPLECHALQEEELEALRAIYDQDMTPLNDDCTCFVMPVRFLSDEIKEEDVIKIWFSLPPNYPCVPPIFEIEANRSGSFTYLDADELFDLLMAESINRIGGMMVFDLVTIAQDFMPDLVEKKRERAAAQAADDLKRKHEMELEEVLGDATRKRGVPQELLGAFQPPQATAIPEEEEEECNEWDATESYKHGRLHKPVHFTGPISDVIKRLPEGLQIIRIENILRQDLAERFHESTRAAVKALWNAERKYPMMYNLKPQIAFHGTQHKSLPSIVHHGLMIPGQDNDVKVRCGSSLGLGIYLSPKADFSLCYSDTNRLIVCAALLGRIYKGGHADANKKVHPYSPYQSFVSECGSEWVFFNARQVLPCYVIQVVSQPTKNKSRVHPPPLASLVESSHHEQSSDLSEREKKTKLLARARKFLPYGFGPGGKTVIEDAASFDDDEEDYGDFQELRYAAEEEEKEDMFSHERLTHNTELQKYRFRDPNARTESVELGT